MPYVLLMIGLFFLVSIPAAISADMIHAAGEAARTLPQQIPLVGPVYGWWFDVVDSAFPGGSADFVHPIILFPTLFAQMTILMLIPATEVPRWIRAARRHSEEIPQDASPGRRAMD